MDRSWPSSICINKTHVMITNALENDGTESLPVNEAGAILCSSSKGDIGMAPVNAPNHSRETRRSRNILDEIFIWTSVGHITLIKCFISSQTNRKMLWRVPLERLKRSATPRKDSTLLRSQTVESTLVSSELDLHVK